VQFTFSQARPESLRVGAGFGAQSFQFGHRFDVSFGSELVWWWEDARFVLKGFNVAGHDC
jgi:hypothetical protein